MKVLNFHNPFIFESINFVYNCLVLFSTLIIKIPNLKKLRQSPYSNTIPFRSKLKKMLLKEQDGGKTTILLPNKNAHNHNFPEHKP